MKILIFYFHKFNFIEKNAFKYLASKNNKLFFVRLLESSNKKPSFYSLEYFLLLIKNLFFNKEKFVINHKKLFYPELVYIHNVDQAKFTSVKNYLTNNNISSPIIFSDSNFRNSKGSILKSIISREHSICLNLYLSINYKISLLEKIETPTSRLFIINYKKLINLSICYLDDFFLKAINLGSKKRDLKNPFRNDISDYKESFLIQLIYLKRLLFEKKINKEFDVFFYSKKEDPKKINSPDKYHSADPFLVINHNDNYVFFEEYDKNKGHISLIKLTKNSSKYLGKLIDENFHLSFPFILKDRERFFMIPESCNDKSLRLYESKRFPFDWEFKMKLLQGVDLADSIIIRSRGIYFILTSERLEGYHNYYKIFYSNNIESTNWKPHKLNPIMINRYSRNAGLINNNILIFQQYNFNDYGNGIRLFKIKKLTKDDFEILEIDKNHFIKHDTKDTHHLSTSNNLVVFDKQKII